jgi:hypothetical protein
MKNFYIFLIFSFLLTFSAKANPWLIIEGIGIGVQILEAGAEKLKDINKNKKAKKKLNKKDYYLKEGSKIITFLQCKNIKPFYRPNVVFKIDLENNYIKIDEGESGKAELSYLKINSTKNLRIISNEAFSPIKKEQKKITELSRYIDVTHKFDVQKKTIEINILLAPNTPNKIKKKFTKNIKEGKLTNNINVYCDTVLGERYLVDKNKIRKEAKRKVAEKKKKQQKQARNEAIKEANKIWIDLNKKDYLYSFIEKLNQYRFTINDFNSKREKLLDKFNILELEYKETNDLIENIFKNINNKNNQEIKKFIIKISNLKKKHTSNSSLEYYRSKLDNIKKTNYENYINYKLLKNLINNAAKSNKSLDFLGKEGFEIKLPNIAGGGTFKIGSDKIGFIEEFKDIKNRNLGPTSEIDLKNLNILNNEIDNNIKIIDELTLHIDELKFLDDEISNRNFYLNFLKQNPFYKFYQLLNAYMEKNL